MKFFNLLVFSTFVVSSFFGSVATSFATQCTVNGTLPDTSCTPGVALPVTAAQVCVSGYSKSVRNVSAKTKNAVFAEYGITSHPTGAYEVDHLISLELGGSNDIKNLFPEAALPTPGFHEKDKVENYLHQQVCSGKISLKTAQYQIATNWLSAYTSMNNAKKSTNVSAVTPKVTPTPKAQPAISTSSPAVKKSVNNLCHAKGTRYYNQTKTFTSYVTIKDCLASGGKLPK